MAMTLSLLAGDTSRDNMTKRSTARSRRSTLSWRARGLRQAEDELVIRQRQRLQLRRHGAGVDEACVQLAVQNRNQLLRRAH